MKNDYKNTLGEPVSHFLSHNVTAQTKTLLVKKGKLFSNDTKITEIFHNFFENTVNKLGRNKDDA